MAEQGVKPAGKKVPAKKEQEKSAAAQVKKERKPRSTAGAAEAKAAAKMTKEEWVELQVGMLAKWPKPAYMATPRSSVDTVGSYRDETFEFCTRWMAETVISYRPHAKAPGSKSHVRYEEYAVARTVAESLALGSYPIDWCFDYEHGYIKVEGPFRDEPLDISKIMDESVLTDVDRAIHTWYRRELARTLGLNYKDLFVGKGGGESTYMRAHRLVAQREAKKRLAAAKAEGRKITEDEALKTLQEWAFGKNPNRNNVMPDGQNWVWSDTLGLLRDRVGDIHLTSPTKTYPEVTELLNQYLLDRLPKEVSTFKWTSLNLNCNYAAKLHRDGNNFGPSFIKAFGDFTGGELNYFPEDDRKVDKLEELKDKDKVSFDLKGGLALFNGNCGHSVNDFKGERFSVVYFTIGCYDKAPQDCKDELVEHGFVLPASDEDRHALLRTPRGYSNSSRAAKKAEADVPTSRYFGIESVEKGVKRPANKAVTTPSKRSRNAKDAKASKTDEELTAEAELRDIEMQLGAALAKHQAVQADRLAAKVGAIPTPQKGARPSKEKSEKQVLEKEPDNAAVKRLRLTGKTHCSA